MRAVASGGNVAGISLSMQKGLTLKGIIPSSRQV
jgi:hypothetical protein